MYEDPLLTKNLIKDLDFDNFDTEKEQKKLIISECQSLKKSIICTTFEAFKYIKELKKYLFSSNNRALEILWELEDIIIKDKMKRQPKITDFLEKE